MSVKHGVSTHVCTGKVAVDRILSKSKSTASQKEQLQSIDKGWGVIWLIQNNIQILNRLIWQMLR